MIQTQDIFIKLKKNIHDENKILRELSSLYSGLDEIKDSMEKSMTESQIGNLVYSFKRTNKEIREILEKTTLIKSLNEPEKIKLPSFLEMPAIKTSIKMPSENIKEDISQEKARYGKNVIRDIEKESLKRFRKKEKGIKKIKEKKASHYVRTANKFFGKMASSQIEKGRFANLQRDLVKANMSYLAKSYLSVVFFTAFLAEIISIFIFIFFLFFNISSVSPFIIPIESSILSRLGTIFWILVAFPLIAFMFTYFYPSLEKKSVEGKINQELPFATIHMSAISESLVEPSNIFRIIISTGEYPHIGKEFTKLLNEINVYGKDLVSALRNAAFNSPSKKLAELMDGLATTITSGGDLSLFFEKRAQTLLFEYKLDREKNAKTSETFMDIYISVVIAAPMILMLLLIMMRVSGLGISLSTSMISLIMVLGVAAINVFFLIFLQMRQPKD